MHVSIHPHTHTQFEVETCFGYIHKENTASLSMNKHTPIFGEHFIYNVRSAANLDVDADVKCEVLNAEDANRLYKQQFQDQDFAWRSYFDVLTHKHHAGTFSVSNDQGVAGISMWDMRSLGKIALNHKAYENVAYDYMLCHNSFYFPSETATAKGQMELMSKLIRKVQLYCRQNFGIDYVFFQIDETSKEWAEMLDNSFQVVGKTAEFLSGFGINKLSAKSGFVKRFLDPRDFSTLLFFKHGNTTIIPQDKPAAAPHTQRAIKAVVSPRVDSVASLTAPAKVLKAFAAKL
jgi:hypothetical protein